MNTEAIRKQHLPALLVALTLCGLGGIPRAAAQPGNDQCAGAVPLTAGAVVSLNTAGATLTADPVPSCQTNFGAGVWYTFTPASNGLVTISTCGSDFDTLLAVYTGACGTLVPLAGGCIDDDGPACQGAQASLSFAGTAATVYRILVGGYEGGVGNLRITATLGTAPPGGPANDLCSGAIAMTPATAYNGRHRHRHGSRRPLPSVPGGIQWRRVVHIYPHDQRHHYHQHLW